MPIHCLWPTQAILEGAHSQSACIGCLQPDNACWRDHSRCPHELPCQSMLSEHGASALARKVCGGALGGVDPVLGLGVLGVIDLLGRVHGRVKVLQDAARLLLLAVDQQLVPARAPVPGH